jgi:hypothetical protein
MQDSWIFGWTQLLTIIGFAITIAIAVGGFRTFDGWKREKLEERRIDIAFEALTLAYQSQGVFDAIRNPGSFGYESENMPRWDGESDENYNYRKSYYVILKRIDDNKDFFMQSWKLQPRFMAMFGPEKEQLFKTLHMARVDVMIAAQMLMRRDDSPYTEEKGKRRMRMEADIWSGMAAAHGKEDFPDGDRVQNKLDEFKNGIISLCRPVVDKEFKVTA